MTAAVRLHFTRDAAEFLAAAGAHLAAEPVLTSVVAVVAERTVKLRADGIEAPAEDWWLTVTDDTGAVVGAAMRTARFSPRPLYLLPMPDEAAAALARALHERGEEVLGVNGALPAAERCAAELVRLQGGESRVVVHTRLHELRELVPPAPAPGRLVVGTEDDVALATAWFTAFTGDADEQGGRPRGSSAHEIPKPQEMRRRLRAGTVYFWVDDDGRKVHIAGATPPAFGVVRIGPVYTPPEQRGRGWASSAVAEVSRRWRAAGARVCLFTDQANPTSNKIYAALGFQPVVDMANLAVTR